MPVATLPPPKINVSTIFPPEILKHFKGNNFLQVRMSIIRIEIIYIYGIHVQHIKNSGSRFA